MNRCWLLVVEGDDSIFFHSVNDALAFYADATDEGFDVQGPFWCPLEGV